MTHPRELLRVPTVGAVRKAEWCDVVWEEASYQAYALHNRALGDISLFQFPKDGERMALYGTCVFYVKGRGWLKDVQRATHL